MKIAFIQYSAADESLALCDLSAELIARRHSTRLFLLRNEGRLLARRVRRWGADLAIVQASLLAGSDVGVLLRALPPGLPAVLVGTGATFDDGLLLRVRGWLSRLPEAGRPQVLGVLRGEVDDSGPALVEALEASASLEGVPGFGRLDGDTFECNPWGAAPDDFDSRPLPDRDLYYGPYPFIGKLPLKRFSAGRGCMHACRFCYLPGLRRGHQMPRVGIRRKSVARLLAEVGPVRARWPMSRVHFSDDLFAPDDPWMEEFAARWPAEVGLPFSCQTSAETLTERRTELLARAGAVSVTIGIETGVEDIRRNLLGRGTTDRTIEAAVERLRRHGISLVANSIFGSPGQGLDEAIETLGFNQRHAPDHVRPMHAYPTPGTPLAAALQAAGRPAAMGVHRRDLRAWAADPEEARALETLLRLFPLSVRHQIPPKLVRRLALEVPPGLLAPLRLYDAAREIEWSGVSRRDALLFALRAGLPTGRVTLHASVA